MCDGAAENAFGVFSRDRMVRCLAFGALARQPQIGECGAAKAPLACRWPTRGVCVLASCACCSPPFRTAAVTSASEHWHTSCAHWSDMDYLRSAASAVLSKSSGPFPNFTIGAPISDPSFGSTIWSIYEGTKRDDGSPCTIFVFETANSATARNQLLLAKNALRKLRTLRHPDVLKLIDSNESGTGVYIAVEAVRLLQTVLADWTHAGAGAEDGKREWIAWGLSKVAVST